MPSSPPLLVRCDGSHALGLGHVRRCLSLAGAWRDQGWGAAFAMQDLPGAAWERVRAAGFPVERLPAPADEGADLTAADGERAAACARRAGSGLVLVDSYRATAGYLHSLKAQGFGVAVLDDLADRDLTAADWLLNQNLGADGLRYQVRPDCERLTGPAYALLRPEFRAGRQTLARSFSAGDSRVLLTLGGGDMAGEYLAVFEALEPVRAPLQIRCAAGGSAASLGPVEEAARRSRHQVRILHDASDMAAQMAWADVSVNAGGSTCWELCCLGVPMLILPLSPDQGPAASALDRAGCAATLRRWHTPDGPEELRGALRAVLSAPERRQAMSRTGYDLVDGLGAERAARSLAAVGGAGMTSDRP